MIEKSKKNFQGCQMHKKWETKSDMIVTPSLADLEKPIGEIGNLIRSNQTT